MFNYYYDTIQSLIPKKKTTDVELSFWLES